MKLYPNQLNQQLAKSLQANWLVFGDEPLQKIESIDAIRACAKQQGFEERITFTVDNSFDWSQLDQAYNELSLFATRKIIELEIPTESQAKQAQKHFSSC